MTVRIATVVELLANPSIGGLFDDGRPAWVWDASGRRVLWANAAGLHFFGASSIEDLAERDFVKGGAATHLARVAASGNDRPTMVQLRFYRGFKAANTMIQCRPATLDDGAAVVLGHALQPAPGTPSDETERLRKACAAAVTDGEVLAVLARDGTLLAATQSFPDFNLSGELDAMLGQFSGDIAKTTSKRIDLAGTARGLKLARLGDSDRLVAALIDADMVADMPGDTGQESGGEAVSHAENPPEMQSGQQSDSDQDADTASAASITTAVATAAAGVSTASARPADDGRDLSEQAVTAAHDDDPSASTETTMAEAGKTEDEGQVASPAPGDEDAMSEAITAAHDDDPSISAAPTGDVGTAIEAEAETVDDDTREAIEPAGGTDESSTAEIDDGSAPSLPEERAEVTASEAPAANDDGEDAAEIATADEAGAIEDDHAEPQTPDKEDGMFAEDTATAAADAIGETAEPDATEDAKQVEDVSAAVSIPSDDTEHKVVSLPLFAGETETDGGADAIGHGEKTDPAPGFVFEQRNRPDRFVWQMNTDGRFTFVSHEFANAVGPRVADLIDRDWTDIAAEYHLDDGGKVAEAIERRDTWSGITIDWPVEGTDLRLPVDLAALPAFGGGRIFEGYRGFGVCRTMDAKTDTDAVGMMFAAGRKNADGPADIDADSGGTVVAFSDEVDRRVNDATAEDATPEMVSDASSTIDGDAPEDGAVAGSDSKPTDTDAKETSETAEGDRPETSDDRPHQTDPAITAAVLGRAIGAGGASLWSRALDATDTPGADVEPATPGKDDRISAEEPDTPLLSKPERRAFRRIAEALGARLEGDDEAGETTSAKSVSTETAVSEAGESDASEAAENVVPLPSAFASGRPSRIDPTLLDRLPIGVLIARDSSVLYANQPMLDLVDYPSRETLEAAGGLEAIVVGPDDDYSGEAGEFTDRFVRLRRKGGDHIAVAARLHAVPWNDGNALMMSFRAVDSDERIAMPAVLPKPDAGGAADLNAVQRRVGELGAMLDTATDGVLVLDAEGTILRANDSAEALFGANREEMIGQPLATLLAPESRRAANDYLDGLSKPGVASLLNDGREVIGAVAQGGLIPLFMTVGRIGEGATASYCAVLRDITQWKKAEEELTAAKQQAEQASSQKSDFLAKISHEIRTPLNAIIGFSEVMMEQHFGAVGNERYREYLRDIHSSGAHIMSLINDLLDLSKIEAGKLDLSFEAVSTAEVIQECVALMQPQANRDRIIIRTSLPSSVPKIVADPRSLRQIVLNLLSNAIKFNNSGGQVIVSAALEDTGEVTIRVRDTGIGMSDKDIETALEPFRQLHTSRYGGGTGLGLPLTKALVEANRASFSLTSEVSQGTLIEISFPTTRVLAE